MSQVRIYGLCLVKNEDDIISESLTFATRHCERIYVIDNGSTDNTWNSVQELARRNSTIVPFQQTSQPFDNGMRSSVYNAVHDGLTDNDWWLVLDADEFLAEDPRPIIEAAVTGGSDTIKTWQIQFYFTERDAWECEQGNDGRDRPIFDRRRHYLINWQESRLFRNNPRRRWDPNGPNNAIPDWLTRICRRRILNRHYQYRDPEQIDKRLRLRLGHRQFPHVRSDDWKSVIRDSRQLTCYREGDPWRFSPSGVLYFYRRHYQHRMRSAPGAVLRRVQGLLSSR